MIAERPILFTDEMVRAILAGRKTVTRRVGPTWARVQPGMRLWVRECHALLWRGDGPPEDSVDVGYTPEDYYAEYRADGDPKRLPGNWPREQRDDPACPRWRPSIHMPRWAGRLTLEVVSVTEEPSLLGGGLGQMAVLMPRVDGDEARREGFPDRAAFLALWKELHPDYTGPVWRVEFRRLP